MSYRADRLECQQCGELLKVLTLLEAQKVADNPENYILYCKLCARELGEKEE